MTGFTHSQSLSSKWIRSLFIPAECGFLWLVKRQIQSEIWWASEYTDEWPLIDTNILNTAPSQNILARLTFYIQRNKVTQVTTCFNNLYQHKTPSLVTVLLVPWIPACGGLKKEEKAQSNHSGVRSKIEHWSVKLLRGDLSGIYLSNKLVVLNGIYLSKERICVNWETCW